MSLSASPSRGFRAKTSDFIRGVAPSSYARHSQTDLSSSTTGVASSAAPYTSGDEGTKKKITRIPLFRRSRKKSNQSATSSPYAMSGNGRYSSEVGELSHVNREPSTDRRPSEPVISVQPPPLPAISTHHSLTSKFAAHFSHTRSPKAVVSQPKPAVSLHPEGTRSSSLESTSSSGTKSRSTTPRPATERPIITVSLSDNLEEYHDLFVRPADLVARSERAAREKAARAAAESATTPVSSLPSPVSDNQVHESLAYRRGQTPASAMVAAMRHRQTPSNSSVQMPSPGLKSPSDRKSPEGQSGDSSLRLPSSARDSPRPSANDLEKGIPPSLKRRTTVAVGSHITSEDTPSVRSRAKGPPSPSLTRPPSIPLPLPPTPTTPTFPSVEPTPSPITRHPKDDSITSISSREGSVRPRAHTISAAVGSPTSILRVRATPKPVVPPPIVPSPSQREGFDLETASAEELRSALKERDAQYSELSDFTLKALEAQAILEKKIASLEAEAVKQEKTIHGLVHIINGNPAQQQIRPIPSSILSKTRFAASAGSGADSDHDTYRSSRSAIPHRLNYHSDSGAESYATSGAESIRGSGGSGTESLASSIFNRNKKTRRTYVGDSQLPSRRGSMLRSGLPPSGSPPDKALPDVPSSATPTAKRISTSISPSSSTSSLLPPSPSITMSSLSAIPEGNAPSLRPPRQTAEYQEERRMTQASNRVSVSSLASSSTAASSSYSSIKRSRPPSIAQVLEKSPKTEDTLDKLKQFS